MRAFIALEIPETIKKELEKIQKNLAKAGLQTKWINPKSAHLTLAFLGSAKPEEIETIGQVIEVTVSQIKPMKLYLTKIGGFPSPTKARVVFVDLGGELGKLHALALKIRKGLTKEKVWLDPKPFTAHLTLGRIKKRQNLTEIIKKTKINRAEFVVNQVSFAESHLTSTGPIYTRIKKVKLVV